MSTSTQPLRKLTLFERFLRFAALTLLRLFYPRIEVRGGKNLPESGPIVFVMNHPNGLIDPLVLMARFNRPISFLGKSTLFGNPLGKTIMEAFGGLPVYRRRDEGLPGGPRGDANERNEVTFARCGAILAQGGTIALCPEGTTHSNPQLLPMRTGAARIVLGAEEDANWQLGVQIVPVGLWFESKVHFRTSVLIVIGDPFDLAQYADEYVADKEQTIDLVTDKIGNYLDNVVLQTEHADLLSAAPIIAAWTAPQGQALTLPQQHEWATTLLTVYQELKRTDPERLDAFAEEARQYANALDMLGISDPWSLEEPIPHPERVGWLIAKLVISFPFALAGFILSYIPYRAVGPIATAVAPDDTQTSLFKLIGCSIFLLPSWITQAVVASKRYGRLWGLLLFLINPLLAYIALRWGEWRRELAEIMSCNWLQWQRGELVNSLVAQRQALAKQVVEAVEEAVEEELG